MIMNRNLHHILIAGAMALASGMTQWATADGLPVSVSAKVSGDARKIMDNGNAKDGSVIALPAGSVVTFTVTISNGVPLTVTLPPAEKLQGALSELMDGGGDSIALGNMFGKQITLGDVKGPLSFLLVGMSSGVSMAKDRKPDVSALSSGASLVARSTEPFEFGPFNLDLSKVVDLADDAGVSLVSQKVRTTPTSTNSIAGFNVDVQKLIETVRELDYQAIVHLLKRTERAWTARSVCHSQTGSPLPQAHFPPPEPWRTGSLACRQTTARIAASCLRHVPAHPAQPVAHGA